MTRRCIPRNTSRTRLRPRLKPKTRSKPRPSNRKTRGGMGMATSMAGMAGMGAGQPNPLTIFATMAAYGISSLLIGPFYLLASILNMPTSNINHLLGQSLQENKRLFLHVPFYKMIKGCPIKDLKSEKFLLQDDMHIHNNAAVVSCENEAIYPNKVIETSPSVTDSILDAFGMMPDKRKLKHHVLNLFQYIDNLRETDEERKPKIQKLLHHVPYKTLIQCYLIHQSIKCPTYTGEKTVLMDEDVVYMVNPLYYPSSIRDDYTKQVKCMWMHMFQDKFDEKDKQYCGVKCKSCTFNNSVKRMFNKYGSMFSCGQTSSIVSMFNTYYEYLKIDKGDAVFPENAEQVIPYLKKYKVSSDLTGKLEKSDEDEVLRRFHRFMCKYDIIPTVEKQIQIKIQEKISRGYSMQQILDFL